MGPGQIAIVKLAVVVVVEVVVIVVAKQEHGWFNYTFASCYVHNQDYYKNSKILLAGKNFGCGSSREHAPWALSDFGIKSVISSSFADIFYNNCFKNGILPIKIDEKIVVELAEYCKRKEEIEISLEKQEIKYGNKVAKFELDAFKKTCLMEGLDDIALSMEKLNKIDDFEKNLQTTKPWVLNNV